MNFFSAKDRVVIALDENELGESARLQRDLAALPLQPGGNLAIDMRRARVLPLPAAATLAAFAAARRAEGSAVSLQVSSDVASALESLQAVKLFEVRAE
ncbi:MAG: hypothetical protein K1X75_02575 [Leptospirales bacterium]|nr:hypothetical protein [Leptospirales bacterium]